MEEKTIKTAIELRNELEHKIAVLNEAITNKAPVDVVDDAKNEAETTCAKLNGQIKLEEYAVIRNDEHPMRKAILQMQYPTCKVKKNVDKKTGAISYEVGENAAYIDLVELENFCKTQIGSAIGWRYKPEDFARFLAAKATKELGGDWKELIENFRMSKNAERTQIADPTSATQLTKRLQDLIDAIIFSDNGKGLNVYKAESRDIAFLQYTACKKSREPKKVTMPQGRTVLNLVMQIINRIMTGGSYESLYKRNDDK